MRHGAAGEAASDFERRLSPRGRAECSEVAQQFSKAEYRFELILSSSAPRALESANIISSHCQFSANLEARRSLYLVSPETYLNAVLSTPPSVRGLLLVGHNPGLSTLAGRLRHCQTALETAGYVVVMIDASDWQSLEA